MNPEHVMDKRHDQTIRGIVSRLKENHSDGLVLQYAENYLASNGEDPVKIEEILYCIFSLYLIDEIVSQPTVRNNLIDMSSYYYRSESFRMDFPARYMEKYAIVADHIERKHSLFFSNERFIRNYLKKEPVERLGDICGIETDSYDLKCPTSRQLLYINYFKVFPEEFYHFFSERFDKNFPESHVFKQRIKNNYDEFLFGCLTSNYTSSYIKTVLSGVVGADEGFVLVNSGTGANELTIKFCESNDSRSFYHKYWYYENINDNECLYFKDIRKSEEKFDNFFINLKPTNFVDLHDPKSFEKIEDELDELIKVLGTQQKNFNLIIDVTANPFFKIENVPKNIHVIKTVSLSKYMRGMNTAFAGLVIAQRDSMDTLLNMAEYYGLTMREMDRKFLYLDDLRTYDEKVKFVSNFFTKSFSYGGWSLLNVGVSYILVPDRRRVKEHTDRLLHQDTISDRKFTWKLRDRINSILKSEKRTCIEFGDSFLFPCTRINLQGPEIQTQLSLRGKAAFKYRLPRVSIGFEERAESEGLYYDMFKEIIQIFEQEYSKL